MGREVISKQVERQIYAESMGRCMNPSCKEDLFKANGDIIERAHIIPYCETADNSYENLIILCPNCHTDFDKNAAFTSDEVKEWKKIRLEECNNFFSTKYRTFHELKNEIFPLLLENKTIYESYYLSGNRKLWDFFEGKVLVNNRKLRKILTNNQRLIQSHSVASYSNLELVKLFLIHLEEFENTRLSEEKNRHVLFPKEINSMFGISPVKDSILPSVESLEILISKLEITNNLEIIALGEDNPYIRFYEDGKSTIVFLDDTPRLRQLYNDYNCFRAVKVRLESLNFALKYIKSRGVVFEYLSRKNLREILVNGIKIIFVYEYCLSKVSLVQLAPENNSVIVNLHNWNSHSCISKEAYELANQLGVKLLTMDDFYEYINKQKRNR